MDTNIKLIPIYKMDFGKLKEEFREHAHALQDTKDKTARFRAASYNRVVELIESKYSDNDIPTKEKIATLGLTEYMEKKVNEVSEGKSLKLVKNKSKKAKSPLKSITKNDKTSNKVLRKRQVKTRGRSRSRSRSLSTTLVNDASEQRNKQLMKELTNFMGIGEERAKQLIAEGLTKINQLHMKKWLVKLPEETQLFMKLKPLDKIPHDDIQTLEPYINKLQTDEMKLQLVGSYRRGKPFSRDIDVMLISDDTNAIEKFLENLKTSLNNKAYPYSKGKDKLSVVLDVSDILGKNNTLYKLDAFRVLPEDQLPMLLYSTGSKQFNISMRGRAKKKGLLLNQNGLFKKNNGQLVKIPIDSEQGYFEALDMEYKEPKDRI
jgi:DNA polymerase/3'-5' exonuclease PolX